MRREKIVFEIVALFIQASAGLEEAVREGHNTCEKGQSQKSRQSRPLMVASMMREHREIMKIQSLGGQVPRTAFECTCRTFIKTIISLLPETK